MVGAGSVSSGFWFQWLLIESPARQPPLSFSQLEWDATCTALPFAGLWFSLLLGSPPF